MMNKRLVVLAIVGLLVISGVWFLISYLNSFQNLTVNFPSEPENLEVDIVTASFGHAHEVAEDNDYTSKNTIKTIQDNQTVRLKKGTYIILAHKDGFEHFEETISIGDSPETVNINMDYSEEALKERLEQEKPALRSALISKYPIIKNYSYTNEKLYKKGEWYGAIFTRKNSNFNRWSVGGDVYRVVAKKENGKWVVKTDPPQLVLTVFQQKDIPEEILSDVNNMN